MDQFPIMITSVDQIRYIFLGINVSSFISNYSFLITIISLGLIIVFIFLIKALFFNFL